MFSILFTYIVIFCFHLLYFSNFKYVLRHTTQLRQSWWQRHKTVFYSPGSVLQSATRWQHSNSIKVLHLWPRWSIDPTLDNTFSKGSVMIFFYYLNILLTFSPFPPNIKHQTASLYFNDNACLLYLFFLQLHAQYSAYFLFFSPHHCLSRRSHSLPFPPLLYQAHLCYPSWLSWSAADGRTWTDAPWWTQ